MYYGYSAFEGTASDAAFGLTETMIADLVPAIARTGRAFLEVTRPAPAPAEPGRSASPYTPTIDYVRMSWNDGPPWRFTPAVRRTESGWRLDGKLAREEDGEAGWRSRTSWQWHRDSCGRVRRIARADFGAAMPLVAAIAAVGGVEIADADAARLAALLAELGIDPDALPEQLRVNRVDVAPIPHLRLAASR